QQWIQEALRLATSRSGHDERVARISVAAQPPPGGFLMAEAFVLRFELREECPARGPHPEGQTYLQVGALVQRARRLDEAGDDTAEVPIGRLKGSDEETTGTLLQLVGKDGWKHQVRPISQPPYLPVLPGRSAPLRCGSPLRGWRARTARPSDGSSC